MPTVQGRCDDWVGDWRLDAEITWLGRNREQKVVGGFLVNAAAVRNRSNTCDALMSGREQRGACLPFSR